VPPPDGGRRAHAREIGAWWSASDLPEAEQLRALLIEDFKAVFERVDVVVTPASPVTAWQRGQAVVVTGGMEESRWRHRGGSPIHST